ncbi:unnamed protein product [Cyprideis torosa]|uniref:3-dehydroquinate synthase n=1 Tax=Cyprideis torosa TaxID=163714 RepID=A0A7R8ZUK1_9CRUS|nr:unnamed protein product [Cyprideis torosa]CAG0909100.1 unnamed protein product [Cyprideis torosa]
MRGIPFIQIPTTLLSQVDSSVGGKTGVDLAEGKNLVGAFYQPRAVYIDPSVLSTLPQDELRGGFAEIIKYGIIWDSEFFKYLGENRDAALSLDDGVLKYCIRSSCSIKAQVVSSDEKEQGLRRILNFGHTIGHAVEAHSDYGLIHGKAVAIGMAAAARIAQREGFLSADEVGAIIALLEKYELPTEIPPGFDASRLKQYMGRDKKVEDGRIVYVLPKRIGEVCVTDDVDDGFVSRLLAGQK